MSTEHSILRFTALLFVLLMISGCGHNNGVSPPITVGTQPSTPAPPTPPAPAPPTPPTPPAPPPSPVPAPFVPPPAPSDSGSVHHGNAPIVGAHVYLFAANTTGYGNASISLLNPAMTGASDAIGAYVTTATDGSFSMKGDYTCVPNSQVYMYALGGNTGSGDNGASGLLVVMGTCPSTGNFGSQTSAVWINEVSTVAAAYSMAGFATDATHVSSSGTPLAQIGITNAFANASNLSNPSTGAALARTPAGNGTVPQDEIDSLANVLAACVGSTGTTPGSTSTPCATLFVNATADGANTGSQPTNTASAAVNIAHHPSANVAALFALSAGNIVFSPALSAAPGDLTITLDFTDANLMNQPASLGMAIDGSGDVWITSSGSTGVTKLASSGASLSPANGFTSGGLTAGFMVASGSIGNASIAIDDAGNVWITSLNGNSLSKLSNAGAPLSPSTGFTGGGLSFQSGDFVPSSIAIDASSDVWVVGSGVVSEFSNAGEPLSPSTGFNAAAQLVPTFISIDPAGNIWLETSIGQSIAEMSSAGALIANYGCAIADENYGIAIDGQGNKWAASFFGVAELSDTASPTCVGGGHNGVTASVAGIVIDGSGKVWQSVGAIDGSGNIWVQSKTGVGEMVGAATPVVTPLATGVKNGTLGSRP